MGWSPFDMSPDDVTAAAIKDVCVSVGCKACVFGGGLFFWDTSAVADSFGRFGDDVDKGNDDSSMTVFCTWSCCW